MTTIGILGGGQLGRMLGLAARNLGYGVLTLDPEANSPCGQIADAQFVAAFDDLEAVKALAQRSDVITFEFENIPQSTIAALEAEGLCVHPSSRVLQISQDRVFEKTFVKNLGFTTAPFAAISARSDIAEAVQQAGLPGILKTRTGGYDGKGQWRVSTVEDIERICRELEEKPGPGDLNLILEGLVAFEREVSIIAARAGNGQMVFFPIAENTHVNGILSQTQVPATISQRVAEQLIAIARAVGAGLAYVGVFAVEAFLSGETVYVNEMAPRVHNSGHYTLEATSYSQFEAHIRAVIGLPLQPPALLSPAVMVNILGTGSGDDFSATAELLAQPQLHLHLYGKTHAAASRKMGHFTVLRPTLDAAQGVADQSQKMLGWK